MKLLFVVQTSPSDWFIIVFMSNFQEIRLKWSCSLCSICSGIINKLSKQTKMTAKAAAVSLVCVYVSCITPETCFVEKKIFCDFAKLIFVIVSDAIFLFFIEAQNDPFLFCDCFWQCNRRHAFLSVQRENAFRFKIYLQKKIRKKTGSHQHLPYWDASWHVLSAQSIILGKTKFWWVSIYIF